MFDYSDLKDFMDEIGNLKLSSEWAIVIILRDILKALKEIREAINNV